jgi:hypothetical protein
LWLPTHRLLVVARRSILKTAVNAGTLPLLSLTVSQELFCFWTAATGTLTEMNDQMKAESVTDRRDGV